MREIDLKTFCNHWIKGKTERTMRSKFEKNIFDFTTIVGNYSKRFFKTSFTYGGFYGSGTKWQPRKESRWNSKWKHNTLFDSHKLRDGIQGGINNAGKTLFDRKLTARTGQRNLTYNIYTKEESKAEKGKRGVSKKRRLQNYAAVHNSDPNKSNFYYGKGENKVKPVQRQFIGPSKKLDMDVTSFYKILFRGFP